MTFGFCPCKLTLFVYFLRPTFGLCPCKLTFWVYFFRPTFGLCLCKLTFFGGSSRYVGEWVKGKRHGQGEFTSAHGYTYKGGWKDGMKAGTGVESTLPPGNSGTFVGDFFRDLKHGTGVMRYDSGGVYSGDWKAGVRQGRGRELFVSGAKYEGSYYNDMLNGEGFYEAPPVGRDERVKLYKRRLLMEAEKLLVQVRHKWRQCVIHSGRAKTWV